MIEPKKTVKNLNRMRDFGSDREAFHRFDKNERASAFSDVEFQKMMSSLTPNLVTMYPDQTPLYDKLAALLGVKQDEILLTPGSDCAIKIIFETYVEPKDEIVFINPTYAMVTVYAQMFDADMVKVDYSDDLELKFEELIKNISNKSRLVYIANPNQPTGTVLERRQFELLLEVTKKTDTILVVDEAYYEFSLQDYSPVTYLPQYPNLFLVRTFSKAIGLASVRLGYIITQAENINYLYKVKSLSDINLFAVKLGEYLIDNYYIVKNHVNAVRASKKIIIEELSRLGLECIDGHTNFIHIKIPKRFDIGIIAKELREKGILVRTYGAGLPAVIEGCIRISVAPIEEMGVFLQVFKEIMVRRERGG
jgi:histidinol-phosphate aminotransferase